MNLIVTGHGHFASGLLSSVKLITGLDEKIEAIDFDENMTADDLNAHIKSKLNTAKKDELTIIFTDIPGGTPFNQSVLLKNKYPNVEVLTGTNLPVLIEATLHSNITTAELVSQGKDSLKKYSAQNQKRKSRNSDGI